MALNRSLISENPVDYQQTLTTEQVQTALAQSGLDQAAQTRIAAAYVTNTQQNAATDAAAAKPKPKATTAATTTQNPSWIFAVNLPSTYPDFAAMKAAGTGLVVNQDDPNAQMLIDAARQWGIPVGIQVNAPPGITPQEYADRVAAAKQMGPAQLVLDIEQPGKGYEGSPGWQWSQQAAALLKPIVGDTAVAVTMEPNQADYNYAAYKGLSTAGNTKFWVQSYTGDMTGVDPSYATSAAAAAVGAGDVVAVLGPTQVPSGPNDNYVSFGIPHNGASAAGVYAGLTPVGPNTTPGTGSGVPGDIPETGPTPPGSPAPPPVPPTTTTTDGTGSKASDWAQAYFGNLGLPPDVQEQVAKLFAKYPDDPQLAVELAKQYIRTTPWFGQNFPGFFEGVRTGLFTDETGYRGYVNAVNVYTHQYFNRPVTTGEVESALAQGLTPEILGKTFEGMAIANAQAPEWKYELGAFGEQDVAALTRNDPGQTTSDLGREQAGLGSAQGARLQAALDRATKRMQSLFGGQLAIPNTAGQALAPSSRPDIGA